MRRFAVVATVLASTILSGCATGQMAPSPIDRLVTLSGQQVDAYAADGKSFLDKGGSAAELMEKTQQAVANQLKDPGAAQFRNVRLVENAKGTVVCGELNGKNSYGAYTGFKRFVGSPSGGTIESTGSRYAQVDASANYGLNLLCH